MKRQEKNRQTRRRIMDSALAEFSRRGYGASSVNTICAGQDISKGIIYHYFATKDDLFLACVEECFTLLTGHLRDSMAAPSGGPQAQLEGYFTARMAFFQAHPVYQRIFCEAVITPPDHLREEILARRRDFDRLNTQILERLLAPMALRPQVTRAEVADTLGQFQDLINAKYRAAELSPQEFAQREASCRKALDILLYGIVDRKEEETHG